LRNRIINLGDSFGDCIGGCEVDRQPGKFDYRTNNGLLLVFGVFVIPFLLLWGEHRIKTSGLKFGLSASDLNIPERVVGLEALALLLAVTTFLVGFEVSRVSGMLTDWKDLQVRSLDRLLQQNQGYDLLPLPNTFQDQTWETPFAPAQDNTTKYMRLGIAAMGGVSSVLLFYDVNSSGFVDAGLLLMQAVHISICVIGCRIVQDSEKAKLRHDMYQPEICYGEFKSALDDYLATKDPAMYLATNDPAMAHNPASGKTSILQRDVDDVESIDQRINRAIHRLDDSLPAWCWLQLVNATVNDLDEIKVEIERIHTWAQKSSEDDIYGTIARLWCSALLSENPDYRKDLEYLCLEPKFGGLKPEFKVVLGYARKQTATFDGGDLFVELALYRLLDSLRKHDRGQFRDVRTKVVEHLEISKTLRSKRKKGSRSRDKSINLTGVDLSKVNLNNAFLYRADFTDANLTNAKFIGANLTDADFTGANLTDADFTGANLTGANLTDADLTKATLTDANLSRVNFSRADLTGFDLTLTDANLTDADFTGAILSRVILSRADLTKATLTKATLTKANLEAATLDGADLNGADLNGAILRGTLFRGANLTDANLKNAWLLGTSFRNAILTGADLREVKAMSYEDFQEREHLAAEFGRDIREIEFHPNKPDLGESKISADFTGADLTNADFTGADLTNADFTGADLTNAKFIGAITDGTNFDDVIGHFIRPDGKWSSDS